MSKLSFEGIGAVVATFSAGEGVKGGQPVKLTGNGAVGPCSAGEAEGPAPSSTSVEAGSSAADST